MNLIDPMTAELAGIKRHDLLHTAERNRMVANTKAGSGNARNAASMKLHYVLITIFTMSALMLVVDFAEARAMYSGEPAIASRCDTTPCSVNASDAGEAGERNVTESTRSSQIAYTSGPVPALPLMSVATTANHSVAGAAALLATLLVLVSGMASGLRQGSLL